MSTESTSKALFKKYMGLNVSLLRFGGLFSMDSIFTGENKKPSKWEAVFVIVSVIPIYCAIAAEVNTIIIFLHTDKQSVIACISGGLDSGLSGLKGIRMLQKRGTLRHLLHRLGTMWDHAYESEEYRPMMLKYARRAHFAAWILFVNVCAVLGSYALSPIMGLSLQYFITKNENNTYNLTTMYPGTYPIDYNDWTHYIIVILGEYWVAIAIIIYIVETDTLFGQLISHLAIHFEILRYDLGRINEDIEDTSIVNQRKATAKLIAIIKRHRQLHTYCDLVETIYSPLLLLTMITSSVGICLCVYEMQSMISVGHFLEGFKYTFHLTGLICELLFYCGFSSSLTNQTILMAEATYNCPWHMLGKRFGALVHILMLRTQRPFYITAYNFFPITLELFTKVIRTAASYFTLLTSLV